MSTLVHALEILAATSVLGLATTITLVRTIARRNFNRRFRSNDRSD